MPSRGREQRTNKKELSALLLTARHGSAGRPTIAAYGSAAASGSGERAARAAMQPATAASNAALRRDRKIPANSVRRRNSGTLRAIAGK